MSKTHWKKLHNPDYLGAYALDPGKDLIATIREVKQENVTGPDGKKEECSVMHFRESSIKPMILNVTNSRTIERIAQSPYIEDWAGHKIQIYIESVKAFGDVVDALRIRPKAPAAQKQILNKDHPKWAAAVKSLSEGNTTIEAIKKTCELSAEDEAALIEEANNA